MRPEERIKEIDRILIARRQVIEEERNRSSSEVLSFFDPLTRILLWSTSCCRSVVKRYASIFLYGGAYTLALTTFYIWRHGAVLLAVCIGVCSAYACCVGLFIGSILSGREVRNNEIFTAECATLIQEKDQLVEEVLSRQA